MSEQKTSTEEILVHLAAPGGGGRDCHLPAGATLADLLRLTGTSLASQAILVDGLTPEEALQLREGMVVAITPGSRSTKGDEPWRAVVPSFRDEALFQEYCDVLKAHRAEVYPDEDQGE